jgi:disulfide oxidoreductase YuzD
LLSVGNAAHVSPVAISIPVSTTIHDWRSAHVTRAHVPVPFLLDKYITETNAVESRNTAKIIMINHLRMFLLVDIDIMKNIKQ